MPLIKRKSLLAAVVESTSGTIEALANSNGNENFFDVTMTQDMAMSARMAQSSFDSLPAIHELRGATCKFKTEVHGDGAAGVPFWASVLLPACGFVVSTQTYSPKTENPGSNVKTLTLGWYHDGRLFRMRGCAGNAKFVFETGKLAYVEWEFKGVWQAPTDASLLTPTYPTNKPLRVGNATFTIGSYTPYFSKMEIDLGNDVQLRPYATASDGSGFAAAVIANRQIKGTIDPEAGLVATKDLYGELLSHTEAAFSFDLEDSTDKITWAMPKFQWTKVNSDGDRAGQIIDSIEFQANKSSGNDALTIAFSAP